MCQFLMCHLIDNIILIMSYMLALELNIILVSYLITNIAMMKNWMGALKQGKVILKENKLSSLMNTCFSFLWCFCAHMKIFDQSHLK